MVFAPLPVRHAAVRRDNRRDRRAILDRERGASLPAYAPIAVDDQARGTGATMIWDKEERAAWAPPEQISPSQWAEKYRYLPRSQ